MNPSSALAPVLGDELRVVEGRTGPHGSGGASARLCELAAAAPDGASS